MQSELGESDVKEYLILLYFGPVNDPVRKSVGRAYRDFNRTLRGLSRHPGASDITSTARAHLQQTLNGLQTAEFNNQDKFDNWHETLCAQLKQFYGEFPFTVGQAQKWVNMSVKYLFVLDRSLVESHWQYCHIPIDKIIIQQLRQLGYKPPFVGPAWSRLDSYERYLEFEDWFRHTLPGIPMDNEFHLWQRSPNSAGDDEIGGGDDIDGSDNA